MALSLSATEVDPNNGIWTDRNVQLQDTPEAQIMVRVGDIDNFGFGWPEGYDPFSGRSTGAHDYPWITPLEEAEGTDRIMVISSYDGSPPQGEDGYTSNTFRPDNSVRPITLQYSAAGVPINNAVLQMFVDDFQASLWGAVYQARIKGKRAPFLEKVLNLLVQTGPEGRLITLQVPEEFFADVASGTLSLKFDDPTTGAGDGYAIDFVKLLINTKGFGTTGTIEGTVIDSNGEAVAGVDVISGDGARGTTDEQGHYRLLNVAAGSAYVTVSSSDYAAEGIVTDLEQGGSATADFTVRLRPVVDLRIDLTASPDPAAVGTDLTYTIKVANFGPADATGVGVTNSLPAELALKSATSSQGSVTQSASSVIFDLGDLAAGASAEMKVITRPRITGVAVVSAVSFPFEKEKTAFDNFITIQTEITGSVSVLRVLDGAIENDHFECWIETEAGKNYRVESSIDFSNWRTVANLSGSGNPMKIVDPSIAGAQAEFYRAVRID